MAKNCQAWSDSACSDANCKSWSKQGECTANPNYMLKQCPEQCGTKSPQKTKNDLERERRILAKKEYDDATTNKNGAPHRFTKAERNYHRVWNKMPVYNDILRARHMKEARNIVKGWDTIFNDYYSDLESLIDYYTSQYVYVPQLKDMNVIYKQKNKTLYDDLKKAVNDSNVNVRLTNYYNDTSEYQRIINEYLKVFYWIVFAAFIIMFIFLGGWRNIKTYAFIITLILFPLFLINPLIRFVFENMEHVAIDYFYLGIGALILIVFSCLSYFNNLALSTLKTPT